MNKKLIPTLNVSSSQELTGLPNQNLISFTSRDDTVMTLDSEGMTYLGKRIEDAGEAHRIFLEVMNKMKLE